MDSAEVLGAICHRRGGEQPLTCLCTPLGSSYATHLTDLVVEDTLPGTRKAGRCAKKSGLSRALIGIATAAIALYLCSVAYADDIQEPADPLGKAAFEVLNKHCARCHQVGRLVEREKPASGFGNILKFNEIDTNAKLIVPGDGHASYLVQQIVNEKMPQDYWDLGTTKEHPSKEDIDALVAWIDNLGKTVVASCRPPISNKDVVSLIAKDLDSAAIPQVRKLGTRYLTLTNIYNSCVDDKTVDIYRQGAIKLVNSLARLSTVTRIDTIDPAKTILRINIDDLGWSATHWETILAVYPYATRPPDSLLNEAIESVTKTKLAYVRADWFAFTASRPPLYNRLLGLPTTVQELERQLSVDVTKDLETYIAKRVGFQNSGVSENNRLIERHPSRSGYFWTSYDFGSNGGVKSLFEHPLGPGGPDGFQHDGGETIFSLPNGFQGYFLNNAKGQALEKGPTNIVRDANRAADKRDPSVINGISCMGCHVFGMQKATDEIRSYVVSARGVFSKATRDAVTALYPEAAEMTAIMAADEATFKNALTKAGITFFVDGNGTEIIYALSNQYERPLTLQVAAAEFGESVDEFKKSLADGAEGSNKLLVNLLLQGKVPRDRFERNFVDLAKQITDDQIVSATATPISVAKFATSGLDLSLTSDKTVYHANDTASFTIVSSQACFLTLVNLDEKGTGATVIFPNKFQQDNRIVANTQVIIPGPDAPFQFRLKDTGTETVIAVCTDKDVSVDGISHDFGRAPFTSVPDYTRSIARGIAVERARIENMQTPRAEISRTAIKVQVH
jgi:hypothetical protein